MDNFNKLYTKKEKKSVDDYTVRFGKFKNKSFKELYQDKPYVKYLLDTLDKEKNSVLLNYLTTKIETDFSNEKLEETKKHLCVSK